MSAEVVGAIVRPDKLESLSRQNNGTTDDDAAQFAMLTKLTTLLPDKSTVTDRGLQSLKSLPASSGGISNTPIGPFQTTVLADLITSESMAIMAGPMSKSVEQAASSRWQLDFAKAVHIHPE